MRLPLKGTLSDTSAKIQSVQSDIKWLCQLVGNLKGELESQRKDYTHDGIEETRNFHKVLNFLRFLGPIETLIIS